MAVSRCYSDYCSFTPCTSWGKGTLHSISVSARHSRATLALLETRRLGSLFVFMKRDLAEFTQVVQHDTACTIAATASVVKDRLAVSIRAGVLSSYCRKQNGVNKTYLQLAHPSCL